jgi:hypothetical protein
MTGCCLNVFNVEGNSNYWYRIDKEVAIFFPSTDFNGQGKTEVNVGEMKYMFMSSELVTSHQVL